VPAACLGIALLLGPWAYWRVGLFARAQHPRFALVSTPQGGIPSPPPYDRLVMRLPDRVRVVGLSRPDRYQFRGQTQVMEEPVLTLMVPVICHTVNP
jgi:hypothetical protein